MENPRKRRREKNKKTKNFHSRIQKLSAQTFSIVINFAFSNEKKEGKEMKKKKLENGIRRIQSKSFINFYLNSI